MELSIETMPIAFINNKQPNFGSSYKDILSIRVLVLLSISFLEGGDGIWETSQEKRGLMVIIKNIVTHNHQEKILWSRA